MIVRAKKLTKRFGSVVALDSVDLEIPGGLTVVVGPPNGGGKSTFMKIATGAYRPSGGCIEVLGGKDLAGRGSKEASGGASFDPPALPPLRTGREWLEYVSEARGGGNGRDVTEAAETFGIEGGFVDKRVRDYSAGMRKRVSLAQAFVGDPELVFLDEPLANLDLEGMKNVVGGVIQRKHEEGLNLVVISHIWRPFLEMADYAVFIAAGRVQASGDPDEVLPLIEGASRCEVVEMKGGGAILIGGAMLLLSIVAGAAGAVSGGAVTEYSSWTPARASSSLRRD